MGDVRWFRTSANSEISELIAYDRYRVTIVGELAVLVVDRSRPSSECLLAARHDAARRYPPVPPRIQALVSSLDWHPFRR